MSERRRRPEGERRRAPTVPGRSVYTAMVKTQETPEVRGELEAWADGLGVSASVVVREALRAGLAACRPAWQARCNGGEGGTLDVAFLAGHLLRAGFDGGESAALELAADLARDRRDGAE